MQLPNIKGMNMGDDASQRLEVVERLTALFRLERMVYLSITIISFLVLVGCALSMIVRNELKFAELTLLFGSSGSIAYTAGRLLYMWTEALRRVFPPNGEEKRAP